MRNQSTLAVSDLVKKDKNVIAITADNGNAYYEDIKSSFPNQFIDYGIAESNMVASAAGLATAGKIPFIYAVTNFMIMRAFEFVRIDICDLNANVKFIGRSASMVTGTWGITHHGTEDLALLRVLPNIVVITPATPMEAKLATLAAYEHHGPVYIRLEAANEPELYDENYQFTIGNGVVIRKGEDITIISTGSIINEAIKAAEELELKYKINTRIINLHTIKPIDEDIILAAARETNGIITLEEHSVYGGLGSAVAEVLAKNNIGTKFKMMGLHGFSKGCGTREEMRIQNDLSYKEVSNAVKDILKRA